MSTEAWMLIRKRDGFIRGVSQCAPSEESLQIAAIDGDEYVPMVRAAQLATSEASRKELREALALARKEFDGLPRSLGYEFTHLPVIDAALANDAEQR